MKLLFTMIHCNCAIEGRSLYSNFVSTWTIILKAHDNFLSPRLELLGVITHRFPLPNSVPELKQCHTKKNNNPIYVHMIYVNGNITS